VILNFKIPSLLFYSQHGNYVVTLNFPVGLPLRNKREARIILLYVCFLLNKLNHVFLGKLWRSFKSKKQQQQL
jgi:hypothetical protein